MAITKRKNGTYQVKLEGPDRRWVSKTFRTRREAQGYDAHLKGEKSKGVLIPAGLGRITVDEYFVRWFETGEVRVSLGWRKQQYFLYGRYISPIMGRKRLCSVSPPLVARILNEMGQKSEQTRLHVYSLLRKLFGDFIELFRLLTHNPVIKSLRPKVSP